MNLSMVVYMLGRVLCLEGALMGLPLIVCVLCKLIGLPHDMTLFLTVEAALPAASSITMFSEIYGLNSGYASQTVGTSSLLSVGHCPWCCHSYLSTAM